MAVQNKREVSIEQAAVAILCEAEKAGLDISALTEKAKTGIMGNAIYAWISDHELKVAATEAVDYLVAAAKTEAAR